MKSDKSEDVCDKRRKWAMEIVKNATRKEVVVENRRVLNTRIFLMGV